MVDLVKIGALRRRLAAAKKKNINVDEERELKRERDHSKRQRSIEQG